jgi:hypothetical protein
MCGRGPYDNGHDSEIGRQTDLSHNFCDGDAKGVVAVQASRKDGGDLTQRRSTTTKRGTVQPPPLPGMNVVRDSCSSFAQELPKS